MGRMGLNMGESCGASAFDLMVIHIFQKLV